MKRGEPGEQRRIYRSVWIPTVLTLLLLISFALNAGTFLVVNDPQRSDIIVVLAGETQYRPQRALELLDAGYAPRMMLNVPARSTIYKFTQLELAEKYIQDLPQRNAIQICPIEGLSTRDESHDVEKCLHDDPAKRVLIVTSDYHTRRALSIFRHGLRGRNISIVGAPDKTQFGTRWWRNRQWSKTCLDEWLRLIWWHGFERWL